MPRCSYNSTHVPAGADMDVGSDAIHTRMYVLHRRRWLIIIISELLEHLSIEHRSIIDKNNELCSKYHKACFAPLLEEVLHSGLEYLHILLAVDIDSHRIAAALRVSHLTKDSSVWACDTLDCHV